MKELEDFCKSLKVGVKPRKRDPKSPVRCWREPDLLGGQRIDAFVIILRTRGCTWALESGCSMCGYFNDSMLDEISEQDLHEQIEKAVSSFEGEPLVKVFTSGSFLDEDELPVSVQDHLLEVLFSRAEKVSVESRPEYITKERISQITKKWPGKKFEIGIGLESISDKIRIDTINKGFTLSQYEEACEICRDTGALVKTYVLLKPPFLSEKTAEIDAIETIKKAASYSSVISLNPTNVQKNTLVNHLWQRNAYRPPWLWTVVEVLRRGRRYSEGVHLKCDPAGGGSIRGAHNCGKCDKKVLSAISRFSLSQDVKDLEGLTCECKTQWQAQMETEDLSFGSIVDFGEWR